MPRIVQGCRNLLRWVLLAVFAGSISAASAQEPNFEIHNRDTGVPLALKRMQSRTVIEGPIARTHIEYIADNANIAQIEAAVSLHVPRETVLTNFGYYYGSRFIPGKMYDKGEAWKIYSAVTSRGRDPGIMDRPTAQDYHAQIFPVAPKKDLRVIIELSQMLSTDNKGAHFELPLVQGNAYLGNRSETPFQVSATVTVQDHTAREIQTTFGGDGDAAQKTLPIQTEDTASGSRVTFDRRYTPLANLRLTIQRQTQGLAKSVYSGMVGRKEGFYALTVTAPRNLKEPRIVLRSRRGTNSAMPTRFSDVKAFGDMHIVGRYKNPGRLNVTIVSKNAAPIHFPVYLSPRRVAKVVQNPASALWADKRIAALQLSQSGNFQPEIIRLSQRFMVVSNYTALLAIPQEELNYYRNVLAKRKINTNTRSVGGGGGDPYIAVKAPADAAQVVAIFPDGDVKRLLWNDAKQVWDGRFDIPFGTAEGEYRVTVIVVHHDRHRSRFVLIYQNRLTAPIVDTAARQTRTAHRGEPVRVSVGGADVERVVVVTPWGERVTLTESKGIWSGDVTVPADWQASKTTVTAILYDGAHNHTEVTLDLDIQ